jgi:hypothetical protein
MSDAQIAIRPKASQQLAALIGMESSAMLDTIKAQCFKTNPANVTNEQLAAFVSIAAEMQVNPLLPGMLYAYPTTGGGIVPIMGPDGVFKKLMEHPQVDSWEVIVYPENDVSVAPTHATAFIWRKGTDRPLKYTALFSEWKINSNPNWNTRPRHMLGLRALKHCARQIIHGIPGDEDDRHIMGEINVTPSTDSTPAVERPAPPKRATKGAAAVVEASNKNAAIDVVTTPATPASNPTPAAQEPPKQTEAPKTEAPPPPAPKPAEKVAEKTTGPRTTLIGEEEFVCTVEVKKIFALMINVSNVPTPSVQAVVDGEFSGNVFEFGGAVKDGEAGLKPQTHWVVGAKVKLLLFGRVNKNTGQVMPVVRKVEPVEGSSNTAIDAG